MMKNKLVMEFLKMAAIGIVISLVIGLLMWIRVCEFDREIKDYREMRKEAAKISANLDSMETSLAEAQRANPASLRLRRDKEGND